MFIRYQFFTQNIKTEKRDKEINWVNSQYEHLIMRILKSENTD